MSKGVQSYRERAQTDSAVAVIVGGAAHAVMSKAAFSEAAKSSAVEQATRKARKLGCGVFGGHLQLKSALQLMATAQMARPLQLHTCGEVELAGLSRKCTAVNMTVGSLWRALMDSGDAIDGSSLPLKDFLEQDVASSRGE